MRERKRGRKVRAYPQIRKRFPLFFPSLHNLEHRQRRKKLRESIAASCRIFRVDAGLRREPGRTEEAERILQSVLAECAASRDALAREAQGRRKKGKKVAGRERKRRKEIGGKQAKVAPGCEMKCSTPTKRGSFPNLPIYEG